MNRRHFFAKLLVAQAAFLILPAAKTYVRTWKQLFCPKPIVTPDEFPDVFDALFHATDDLDAELYRTYRRESIWINLIPRGVYPKFSGSHNIPVQIGDNESIVSCKTQLILP